MTKYVLFFSYTAETWANMIRNPGDRAVAARAAFEPVGATMESMYFMLGARDGMVIFEASDAEVAAAVSIAVSSTGAFRSVQTHELIEPDRLVAVLGKAGTALGAYSAPGT